MTTEFSVSRQKKQEYFVFFFFRICIVHGMSLCVLFYFVASLVVNSIMNVKIEFPLTKIEFPINKNTRSGLLMKLGFSLLEIEFD